MADKVFFGTSGMRFSLRSEASGRVELQLTRLSAQGGLSR